MVFEPLRVKELAADGATIETAFPLPLNSLHDLRLTLGTGAVVVKARVVHSHVGEMTAPLPCDANDVLRCYRCSALNSTSSPR